MSHIQHTQHIHPSIHRKCYGNFFFLGFVLSCFVFLSTWLLQFEFYWKTKKKNKIPRTFFVCLWNFIFSSPHFSSYLTFTDFFSTWIYVCVFFHKHLLLFQLLLLRFELIKIFYHFFLPKITLSNVIWFWFDLIRSSCDDDDGGCCRKKKKNIMVSNQEIFHLFFLENFTSLYFFVC